MQDYKNLAIYERSLEYCASVYKFSKGLPDDEKFNIVSQIRRAATSVSLNIAEGAGTETKKEFYQFLSYAYRSINEVLTCMDLCEKLELVKNSDEHCRKVRTDGVELRKMVYRFMQSLKG